MPSVYLFDKKWKICSLPILWTELKAGFPTSSQQPYTKAQNNIHSTKNPVNFSKKPRYLPSLWVLNARPFRERWAVFKSLHPKLMTAWQWEAPALLGRVEACPLPTAISKVERWIYEAARVVYPNLSSGSPCHISIYTQAPRTHVTPQSALKMVRCTIEYLDILDKVYFI